MNKISGKKILILGAGTWLVDHIKKAKELGLKTYVTDWSDTAEGKVYADVFEPIDVKDKEGSLAFARKHQVDAIYTSADVGVQTAAYIAKELNLYYHPEELAMNATNKHAMRLKAKEFGLPIPKFGAAKNVAEGKLIAQQIGYPVIVKPTDNCSSRGVVVIDNDVEMEAQFEETKSMSTDVVLVEELLVGIEGSVEALIVKGEPIILGISDREKSDFPYRYDTQISYPGIYTDQQLKGIKSFIHNLVKGYEIKQGIIHVEIMVNEGVYLVEFGVRSGGSKIITHLLTQSLGYDIVAHQIYNAFGIEREVKFTNQQHAILKFILLPEGEIKEIRGIEEARKLDGVIDFEIERKPGDVVNLIKDGRSRPGYLLVKGDTREECLDVIKKVNATFEVIYKD